MQLSLAEVMTFTGQWFLNRGLQAQVRSWFVWRWTGGLSLVEDERERKIIKRRTDGWKCGAVGGMHVGERCGHFDNEAKTGRRLKFWLIVKKHLITSWLFGPLRLLLTCVITTATHLLYTWGGRSWKSEATATSAALLEWTPGVLFGRSLNLGSVSENSPLCFNSCWFQVSLVPKKGLSVFGKAYWQENSPDKVSSLIRAVIVHLSVAADKTLLSLTWFHPPLRRSFNSKPSSGTFGVLLCLFFTIYLFISDWLIVEQAYVKHWRCC